jgi:tRNA pseudouridine38-40 synthase
MRWAACVEYDGTAYHGWQSQPHAASIQDVLEAALSKVVDAPIRTVCSGRTDAGVHAAGQIVHFETAVARGQRAWLLGSNRHLPDDIAPQWFVPVPENFHARFSACARDYRYWILDRTAPSALWRHRAWHAHNRLDAAAMQVAAQVLVGHHDFSAFRAAACQSKSPWREVHHLTVARFGDWIHIDIRANAFLYHMVRNIVGSLAPVGAGLRAPEWIGELLAGRDRRRAGMTAPACGLMLRAVHYPAEFMLPRPALDDGGW